MGSSALTKQDIAQLTKVVQNLYLEDTTPWVVGYSGGKDSTATLQLVWSSLAQLPEDKRNHKAVHVISTDTLVESPVVAAWVSRSLRRMREAAVAQQLPIKVHRLTPEVTNTFWVNLLGRGYPYPRNSLRWCTSRLKIEPSNQFIQSMITSAGEAILVLGTRKAESSVRRAVMEDYERKRYREYLSPNGSLPNSLVFSPIEDWTNDNVWQYLMQYENPWNHSNKELLAMYRGASSDGECPLVVDATTPSCGNSRFGCWVCTLVAEDKSMSAMIQNDEEKSWMEPLLDFRNRHIAVDLETDRDRRDFRRMNGRLTWHKDRLVHGPYTKRVRENLLRELLKIEQFIQAEGPEEVKEHPLITIDELRAIRRIWLDEKHEFEDTLPAIYEEVTGIQFDDPLLKSNTYYAKEEWDLLQQVCQELYPDESLLQEMQSSLLDVEARVSLLSTRRGVYKSLEDVIRRSFYKNEADAENYIRRLRTIQQLDEVESGDEV